MKEYISREALIEELKSRDFYPVIVKRAIEAIPAADVRPVVHGKWIAVDDEEQSCDEWDCSACKQRRTFMCEMDADDMKEYYLYCPECGAVMDGGKSHE